MIKLIKIELFKLFHKKTIYIVWSLIFIFCLFNNILYKIDYDNEGYYINDYKKNNITELKKIDEKLNNYDSNKKEDLEMYIDIKTKKDLISLRNKYGRKSFQYEQIDLLKEDLYNINYYTYIKKDNSKLEESNNIYQEHLMKFNNNDWKYFTIKERDNITNSINELKVEQTTITNKMEFAKIEEQIKELNKELDIINIRLDNNINYGVNFLNDALLSYKENKIKLEFCNDINTYSKKIDCNNYKANLDIDKYIIKNKVNLKQENNLNSLLRNITEDYEIFIIIIILLVSSTIITEEFTKGYIKLLLIKPYNRSKILLGKYLTCIIILLFTILITILFQLLIGGYLFGYSSLNIKLVLYNFNNNTLEEFSLGIYMFLKIIYHLPKLIMLLTICFTISVISTNTILSFSMTLLIYMFSNTINNLIIKSNNYILNYFITLNWDFKYYLLSSYGPTKFINNKISLIVYLINFLILIVISIITFKKKNIKNI